MRHSEDDIGGIFAADPLGPSRRHAFRCCSHRTYASDGQPVILFQHYGWDSFSTGAWDRELRRFDPTGTGPARWWSAEERDRLMTVLAGFNVIAIFHGHQHDNALIYQAQG